MKSQKNLQIMEQRGESFDLPSLVQKVPNDIYEKDSNMSIEISRGAQQLY